MAGPSHEAERLGLHVQFSRGLSFGWGHACLCALSPAPVGPICARIRRAHWPPPSWLRACLRPGPGCPVPTISPRRADSRPPFGHPSLPPRAFAWGRNAALTRSRSFSFFAKAQVERDLKKISESLKGSSPPNRVLGEEERDPPKQREREMHGPLLGPLTPRDTRGLRPAR